jgi:hypothetical protein
MAKRVGVYLSQYDQQRLEKFGLPLIDIIRAGFAKLELEEDLGKVKLPAPRDGHCPHPPARVHKGLCGQCGAQVRP